MGLLLSQERGQPIAPLPIIDARVSRVAVEWTRHDFVERQQPIHSSLYILSLFTLSTSEHIDLTPLS